MDDLRISLSLKKQRLTGVEETLDDRISQLPDTLLVDILSLLPTKNAFTSCVLSKRWQFLWTSIYNFTFTRSDLQRTENLGTFVDYVFANCTSPVINKLDIDCSDINKYRSRFNGWLHFAAQRNVEHVVFRSGEDLQGSCNVKVYKFPESFRRCSSLSSLHIKDCWIDFDAIVEWKSLKSIKMEGASFRHFNIPLNLLSGCPALEAMELVGIDGMNGMNFESSPLKRLIVKGCDADEDGVSPPFYIFAPYVQHLEFSGDFGQYFGRLANVSSFVSAKLTYKNTCYYSQYYINDGDDNEDGVDNEEVDESSCDWYHRDLREQFKITLKNLSDTTELTELAIGTWFTQVICFLQLKEVPIPELDYQNLTLELDIEDFSLYGAAGFLRASPHVETVTIDLAELGQRHHCRYELKNLAKGEKTDLESYTPSFEFPNLKNVKIVNSLGLCLKDYSKPDHDKIFKLSEFMLKRATDLEKFVIISNTRRCKRCSMNCVSPYLFQLAEQLLGCPRSSNSVIIFQDVERIREMTSCGFQMKKQMAALNEEVATLRSQVTKLEDKLKAERESQSRRHQELITLIQNLTSKQAQT